MTDSMIKTSISGADTADGGELIRILAMHPEVELVSAQGEGMEGRPLSSFHHGLIGETDLSFTSRLDTERCDVLFICDRHPDAGEFSRLRRSRPDLKIISLREVKGIDADEAGMIYGLPEINRKPLVRGATAAYLPSPFASMALVALYPLALNLLLDGDIRISLNAPADIMDDYDTAEAAREIQGILSGVQHSFRGDVEIEATAGATRRSALMHISLGCNLDAEHLMSLYGMYDDHNFSFAVRTPVGASEVAGTDKCVISVGTPADGAVTLDVAADCRLRGGAGEAVHVMNLMCGLHERTGLALKAIDFNPVDHMVPTQGEEA